MPSDLLLPLFPLEVVLMPGTPFPLHIFEERYKLMIGQAIEQQSEFGIVLAKENSVMNVGCTASVEKVVKRYTDGRLDVVTVGRRRFEILFLDEQKPYLQAAVHFFNDDPDTTADPAAVDHLAVLFEKVRQFVRNQATSVSTPDRGGASFQIAALLPLDLDLKQRLLCSRSEAERIGLLNETLEKLLPGLELARRVERSSRGNGRGRR